VSGAAESELLKTVREWKVGLFFDHQWFKPKRLVILGSEGCLSLLRACLLVQGKVNFVFAIQQKLNRLLMHFGYITVVTLEGVEVKLRESGLQVRQAGVTQGVV
jgi:hypothetical protein